MRNSGLIVVFAGLFGCGGDGTSAPELLEGFVPDPPAAGEVQILTPIYRDLQPGSDVTLCTYIDFDVDRDLDVVNYDAFQSPLGHHVLLYAVEQAQAPNTHPCTEEDMVNSRYLGGGGADSPPAYLPEGIVHRVKAGSQLMIQTHWINSTDNPISGQGAFNIELVDASPDHTVADLFTAVTTDIALAPGPGSAHAECVMAEDMQFFLVGGHEHWRGTHIRITHTPAAGTPTVIYEHDWRSEYESNPPRNLFTEQEPFVMRAGDTVSVDCDYMNETASTVRFPQEMCIMWGYYFPADREINCIDGVWPQ